MDVKKVPACSQKVLGCFKRHKFRSRPLFYCVLLLNLPETPVLFQYGMVREIRWLLKECLWKCNKEVSKTHCSSDTIIVMLK